MHSYARMQRIGGNLVPWEISDPLKDICNSQKRQIGAGEMGREMEKMQHTANKRGLLGGKTSAALPCPKWAFLPNGGGLTNCIEGNGRIIQAQGMEKDVGHGNTGFFPLKRVRIYLQCTVAFGVWTSVPIAC